VTHPRTNILWSLRELVPSSLRLANRPSDRVSRRTVGASARTPTLVVMYSGTDVVMTLELSQHSLITVNDKTYLRNESSRYVQDGSINAYLEHRLS
jgi:hypothetical protein